MNGHAIAEGWCIFVATLLVLPASYDAVRRHAHHRADRPSAGFVERCVAVARKAARS